MDVWWFVIFLVLILKPLHHHFSPAFCISDQEIQGGWRDTTHCAQTTATGNDTTLGMSWQSEGWAICRHRVKTSHSLVKDLAKLLPWGGRKWEEINTLMQQMWWRPNLELLHLLKTKTQHIKLTKVNLDRNFSFLQIDFSNFHFTRCFHTGEVTETGDRSFARSGNGSQWQPSQCGPHLGQGEKVRSTRTTRLEDEINWIEIKSIFAYILNNVYCIFDESIWYIITYKICFGKRSSSVVWESARSSARVRSPRPWTWQERLGPLEVVWSCGECSNLWDLSQLTTERWRNTFSEAQKVWAGTWVFWNLYKICRLSHGLN